jgi:fatty-acyl-CoA synthase
MTAQIDTHPDRTLPRVIAELAEEAPDAPAVLSASDSLTYRQLAEGANRYARWALPCNLRKGDIVGLMMPNRPEYYLSG